MIEDKIVVTRISEPDEVIICEHKSSNNIITIKLPNADENEGKYIKIKKIK